MNSLTEDQKELTLNTLKYIAIIAMVIDHVAYAFVPDGTALSIAMHFIGRITGPVMFFSAAEGYHHTRNINKYLLRLAVFALISWFPFIYFSDGGDMSDLSFIHQNVIYTIFMGVLAVRIRREMKNPILKVFLIICLMVLCVPADWGTTGIIMILVFDYYYGNFKNQAFAYCLVVLLKMSVLSMITSPFFGLFYEQTLSIDWEFYKSFIENFGAFLPIALLSLYKGQRGNGEKFSKWFFYIFYPLHLLILGFLQTVL